MTFPGCVVTLKKKQTKRNTWKCHTIMMIFMGHTTHTYNVVFYA